MNFKHIIITRFSIPVFGNQRFDNNDEYLKQRLKLFEKFCIPSVQNQSVHNFTWLVLFGINTPVWLKNYINKWKCDNILIPIYSSHWNSGIKKVRDWISDQNKNIVITTRLDNDDSISKDFVKNIQNYVTEQLKLSPDTIQCLNNKQYYIEPVQGQQLDIRNKDWKFYSFRDDRNHFVSMIELNSSNLKTVYWKKHNEIDSQDAIIRKIYGVMWMQILHSNNFDNKLKSDQKAYPDLKTFPWLQKILR